MSESKKQPDFLSKAEEADETAEKAHSPLVKETWRQIAKNYRNLHEMDQLGRS